MSDQTPSPTDLELWLEWAATKLIATPTGRLKPTGYRTYWPDYVRDVYDQLHSQNTFGRKIRALAPTSDEITIMDLLIFVPNACADPNVRKILHWRAQVHPLSGRHLLTWPWIANRLGVKIYTAKRWHRTGLDEALVKTPTETLCRVSTFMTSRL